MTRGLLTAAVCLVAAPRLPAAEPDYARDVKPLLQVKCYACHGAIRQKGGLRLDAGQLVLKGTKRGEVVIPGDPDQSPLVEAITANGKEHPRMPPAGEGEALSAKDVAVIREWIK
ncbi:MAG TPA: c-type cytochrome domain-containing protein, partial [Gemmata sp.]|nr:c-type cytochrome domain-containing protein [Gemmata sp.]